MTAHRMLAIAFVTAACGKHPSSACKQAVAAARARVADAKAKYVEPATPLVAQRVDGTARDPAAHVVRVRVDRSLQFPMGRFDESGEVVLPDVASTSELARAVATAVEIRPGPVEVELEPSVDAHIAAALLSRLSAEAPVHVIVSHATVAPTPEALRAAAGACAAKALERPVEPNTTYDQLRAHVLDAELDCGCDGASIDRLATTMIELGFPQYEPGWLAVRLTSDDPGRAADAATVVARLAAMTPQQRLEALLP
ncbi:MAG: hypothetical protein ACM31C_22040 [Acidobacteriota bacterium]